MPGPYVQAATFCETVLVEKTDVVSVIRVVDRLMLSTSTLGAPAELPEGNVIRATLFVSLKADDAKGRHPITVRAHQPSGIVKPDHTVDATFEGDERGVILILTLGIEAIEGLHWFDILVNETVLTRVPLRIIYQRTPALS